MNSNIVASLGSGSGINVGQLVRDLSAASRDPKVGRVTALTQQNQARISAVSQARADLNELATSLADLVQSGTLSPQPRTSDDSVVSASIRPGASRDGIAAVVEVVELARAQSMISATVPSRSSPVGQGSLTLTVAGTNVPVVIGAAQDSLDGLAGAINAAGTSVRASIVPDGAGFRLALRGANGAAQGYTLTLDSGSDPALAAYAGGPGGGMTIAQTARDALVKVDGISYSRPDNRIDDIIPGLSLTLRKASAGQPVTIGAGQPAEALGQAVRDFVAVFNEVRTSIRSAIKLAGGGAELRQLDRELAAVVGTALSSHGTINRLADIGVTTTRSGDLLLDPAVLNRRITEDPAAVEALLNPRRDGGRTEATDPGLSLVMGGIRDRAVAGNGALDRAQRSLESRQRALTEMMTKVEAREAAYAARLERQYAGLDNRVGALRATQAYLKQQIALWNGSDR